MSVIFVKNSLPCSLNKLLGDYSDKIRMTLLENLEKRKKLNIKTQAHESIKIYKKLSDNTQKQILYTVKTGVSFRHLLRHRNSASASVISSVKTTLFKCENDTYKCENDTVKCENDTPFILSNAEIKSHSKVSKRHSKYHFQN
jgi:hypothetical protein